MTYIAYKKRQVAIMLKYQQEPLDLSLTSLSYAASSNGGSCMSSAPASGTMSPIDEQNDPEGLFVCDVCPSSFDTDERLKAHQRRHKIKASGRYTCGMCQKSFVQQSSLITHQRIHTGERPYECKICHNTYGDLSTFTKHKRTHSGEKPYQCPHCNKQFSQSGNCLRHIRALHREKSGLLKSLLHKRKE